MPRAMQRSLVKKIAGAEGAFEAEGSGFISEIERFLYLDNGDLPMP